MKAGDAGWAAPSPTLWLALVMTAIGLVNGQCTLPSGEVVPVGTRDYMTDDCGLICHCLGPGSHVCNEAVCSDQSTCEPAAVGKQCACKLGYNGDGFYCFADGYTLPFLGCFWEVDRPRHFGFSPGGYSLGQLNPVVCSAACSTFNMNFAALTMGKICFCADEAPDASLLDNDTACSDPCPNTAFDPYTCGSFTHVSVYRVPLIIREVLLTPLAPGNIIQTFYPLDVDVRVTTDMIDYKFHVDFNDGAGQEIHNQTRKIYTMPGEYVVVATAQDEGKAIPAMDHGDAVLVQAPPQDVTIICPYAVASTEEFYCEIEVWQGSTMKANIDWGDATESYYIGDSDWSSAGTGILNVHTEPLGLTYPTPAAGDVVVNMATGNQFQDDGDITTWEYFSVALGTINFLVVRPTCAYCSLGDSCGTSCTKPWSITCPANNVFCSCMKTCVDDTTLTGTPAVPSNPDSFTVIHSFTHTITTIGWEYVQVPKAELPILAGDRIGFVQSGTGQIAQRDLYPGEDSDVQHQTSAGNVADVLTNSWTQTNSRFLLRAVSSAPSVSTPSKTYVNAGVYTVNITVTADFLPGLTDSNATVVIVQDRINISDILNPEHARTTYDVLFDLAPHTGTNVTYEWNFDDGNVTNTSDTSIVHSFASRGVYNVSIYAWNLIDTSSNWSLIIIEDEILNLNVTSSPSIVFQMGVFHQVLAQGSDYICDWDWDDNTAHGSCDWWAGDCPITGSVHNHNFTDDLHFFVNITCANNVSQDSVVVEHIVQYEVINIHLINKFGSIRNQFFHVEFSVDTGTDPSFNFTFDGIGDTLTYDQPLKLGRTNPSNLRRDTTGMYEIVIVGWNLVSMERYVTNWTVDNPIINVISQSNAPDTTPGLAAQGLDLTLGGWVTYSVTMDEGTTVQVTWNFDDGGPDDTYSLGVLENWPQTAPGVPYIHTVSHYYPVTAPGFFNVSVTVENNYNHSVILHPLLVMNTVYDSSLQSTSPNGFNFGVGKVGIGFLTDGVPPIESQVVIDWGDGSPLEGPIFIMNMCNFPDPQCTYSHLYNALGSYQVWTNISNLISDMVYETEVWIVLPITNLRMNISRSYVAVGEPLEVMASMSIGEQVYFFITWGDTTNSPDEIIARNGTDAWSVDVISHVYQSPGTYDVTVVTDNSVGKITYQFTVIIQYPITDAFNLSSNAPLFYPDAVAQITLGYPISEVLPTDAWIKWDFGDGVTTESVPLTFLTVQGGLHQLTLTHEYAEPGDYIVAVTMGNEASNATFHVSAGTYVAITDLTLTPMFTPKFPLDAAPQPGLSSGALFPPNSDISVHVDMATGTPTGYVAEVVSDDGSVLMYMQDLDSPVELPGLTEPGVYKVTVTVLSPYGDVTEEITVTIGASFGGILIEKLPTVLPRFPQEFSITFTDDLPLDGCVTIDYADGSFEVYGKLTDCESYLGTFLNHPAIEGPVASELQPRHAFEDEGLYHVVITGYSSVEVVEGTIDVVVSRLDCEVPVVVFDETSSFLNPFIAHKSKPTIISTDTRMACPAGRQSTKVWTIQRIDEKTGDVLDTIDLSSVTDLTRSDLNIPATTLPYGFYKLAYRISMDIEPNFKTEVSTYLRMEESKLITGLFDGNFQFITLTYNADVTLEPFKFTYDPDLPRDQDQGIESYVWYCRQYEEEFIRNEDNTVSLERVSYPIPQEAILFALENDPFMLPSDGGCFRRGPGVIAPIEIKSKKREVVDGSLLTEGFLQFNSVNMMENETYELSVLVNKGNRKSLAKIDLSISTNPVPSMLIRCKNDACVRLENSIRINPTTDLRLYVEASSAVCDSVKIQWSSYYEAPHGGWIKVLNFTEYMKGLGSPEIVILRSMFEFGYRLHSELSRYKLVAETWCPASPDGIGLTYVIIDINQAPITGYCNLATLEGMRPSRRHVHCHEFSDSDGLSMYKLYGIPVGGTSKVFLGYSANPAFDIDIPFGDFDIYVVAYDNLGATAPLLIGQVSLAAPTPDELSDIEASAPDRISQLVSEANIMDMTAEFLAISDLLSAQSSQILTDYGGVGIPKTATTYAGTSIGGTSMDPDMDPELRKELLEQYEKQRSELAELREGMIDGLANHLTIDSLDKGQVVATTLQKVTDKPGEITKQAQEDCVKLIGHLTSVMVQGVQEKPLEEVLDTLGPVLATVGNVLAAVNYLTSNALDVDIDRAEASVFAYYDTDWDSDRYTAIALGYGGWHCLSTGQVSSGSDPDEEHINYLVYVSDHHEGFIALPEEDQKRAVLRETSAIEQRISGEVTVKKLLGDIEEITASVAMMLVPGENEKKLENDLLIAIIHKDTADMVSGKVITVGKTDIQLPLFCDLVKQDPCVDEETVIGIVTYSFSFNPYDYMKDHPEHADVHVGSETVSLVIYNNDGTKALIEDSTADIILTISSDRQMSDIAPATKVHATMSVTNTDQDFFYHAFNVETEGESLQIEIVPDDPMVQFLVIVGFKEFPKINDSQYDVIGTVPSKMSRRSWYASDPEPIRLKKLYTITVPKEVYRNQFGRWVIGVREVPPDDHDMYSADDPPAMFEPLTGRITCNYTLRVWVAGCHFMTQDKEGKAKWSSDGMSVGSRTTYLETECISNHTTLFGSGFAVKPNAIDFDYVFANADFYKNPTIYVTMMLILLVYIIGAIWARKKDRKDIEKLGVTPLPDNEPGNNYFYEVSIQTGVRKQAATDSKVSYILSGEKDETEVRQFADSKRKIFRRGSLDSFLLATPRPLGHLRYIRLWHDNSGKGKYGSWFLNYIIVTDLQTRERFYFISNSWYAVEYGDGKVDRLIPLAGPKQMTELKHLVTNTATQRLGDDHLWFSVIARPPESREGNNMGIIDMVINRFTRLQRLSCCLLLLFTTMLANAMYYEVLSSDDATRTGINFGPFSFTTEQLYVGFMSVLVVFPINFLVVTMFRKSRLRNLRPSQIKDAVTQNEKNMIRKIEQSIKTQMTNTDTEVLVDIEERTSTPITRSSSPFDGAGFGMAQPLQPALPPTGPANTQPISQEIEEQKKAEEQKAMEEKEKEKKQKSKFKISLPWWFRIVSWIIMWLATLASGTFVVFYGISFGDERTRKWVTSLVISFMTSIFLTQPIKVLLVAVLFSLIFKKADLIDEVAEEDEEALPLSADEEYIYPLPGDPEYEKKSRKIEYNPPDPESLETARLIREKESAMYNVIREILFYMSFIWVLLVVSYGFRDPNSYPLKENLSRTVVDLNQANSEEAVSFDGILTVFDYWDWLEQTLIPAIRAGEWYNGDFPVGQRGFLHDRVSRIMGYATIRQLRVKKNVCHPVRMMQGHTHECLPDYDMFNEEKETYGTSWVPYKRNETTNETNSKYEYIYRTASELDGWPYLAAHAVYNGGGYIVELTGSRRDLDQKIQEIKQDGWIDRQTRAIFVEFTVYNAFVNLFGITTMLAEFLGNGHIAVSYRVEPMNLLEDLTSGQLITILARIAFVCFLLFFLVKEIRKAVREKKKYLMDIWNLNELAIIILSLASIAVYVYRLIYAKEKTELFKISSGNAYMKFQYVAYWNELLLYLVGWLCFLSSIKFIRLLRFNKRMGMLGATLRISAYPLFLYAIMFMIVFTAFCSLFYLINVNTNLDFSTFIITMETMIQMLVGKFGNFNNMSDSNPVVAPSFFFLYIMAVYFILMEMFLTILNTAIEEVRDDVDKAKNEYELVNFMVNRTVEWTGLNKLLKRFSGDGDKKEDKKTDVKLESRPEDIDEQIYRFPEQMDRLMDYIQAHFIEKDSFEVDFLEKTELKKKKGSFIKSIDVPSFLKKKPNDQVTSHMPADKPNPDPSSAATNGRESVLSEVDYCPKGRTSQMKGFNRRMKSKTSESKPEKN